MTWLLPSHRRVPLVFAFLLAQVANLALAAPFQVARAAGPPERLMAVADGPPPPLAVQGNRLTAGGQPIQLRGVNRAGPEYACIHGWGVFDGRSDAGSVQAIAAWNANVVRIPLNEDCWLGINGVPTQDSGVNYQEAIQSYVRTLHQQGLYAEISLAWSAPGSDQAVGLAPIIDEDHGPTFWSSVAAAFKDDPAVYFGLQGEPFGIDFGCWLNGHQACSGQVSYDAAGMQEALNAVRGAGAGNVVAVSGVTWANDLTGWLANQPKDSLDPPQLAAEAHVYGNNACGAQNAGACLEETIGPVAQKVPVVFGETGETYDQSECSAQSMNVILPWADAHNVSYLAWTWNAWGNCQSLVSSEDGSTNTSIPAGAEYASYVRAHLAAIATTAGAT